MLCTSDGQRTTLNLALIAIVESRIFQKNKTIICQLTQFHWYYLNRLQSVSLLTVIMLIGAMVRSRVISQKWLGILQGHPHPASSTNHNRGHGKLPP
jgi:hypothetical protein